MKPWGIALFVFAIVCIVITIVRIIIIFVKDAKNKKETKAKIKKEDETTNCDSIIIDGILYNYQYCQNNIHIENSCDIKKKFFNQLLYGIMEKHAELDVWKRLIKSLKKELATHNFLYSMGLWKNRTKDVDLNYPLKWYVKITYSIIGTIALIFIK